MSKLRDLLNQQKGISNGAATKPVLQSEPEKTTQQATAKPSAAPEVGGQQKGLNLLDKLKAKSNKTEIRGIVQQSVAAQVDRSDDKGGTQEIPKTVVEQSRPLTMAEKLRARTQNAAKISEPVVSTVEKTILPEKTLQPAEQQIVSQPQKDIQSASQSADAQKTNDGVANTEELKHNLAYLANNIENKELIADVVRTIAVQLKNNPELFPHMTRGDMNLMVRGLRMAYQVAAMKKQEKNEKKKASSKDVMELSQMMKDAGLDFSGLKL